MTRGLRRPWSIARTGIRLFIRCVGNEEVSYGMKAQWAGSQVGAPVALLREGDESPDRLVNFPKNAVGSAWIVSGDVFPNFVQVCEPLLDGEQNRSCTAAVLALLAQPGKSGLAIDGLHTAALDIVVSPIQHVAHLA